MSPPPLASILKGPVTVTVEMMEGTATVTVEELVEVVVVEIVEVMVVDGVIVALARTWGDIDQL